MREEKRQKTGVGPGQKLTEEQKQTGGWGWKVEEGKPSRKKERKKWKESQEGSGGKVFVSLLGFQLNQIFKLPKTHRSDTF